MDDSTPKKVMAIVDVTMQVVQLFLFLSTFSVVTHHIINMELDSEKQNLKSFVLPAIISVFVWMMSISYYLLSIVMNSSSHNSQRLVFNDRGHDRARFVVISDVKEAVKIPTF